MNQRIQQRVMIGFATVVAVTASFSAVEASTVTGRTIRLEPGEVASNVEVRAIELDANGNPSNKTVGKAKSERDGSYRLEITTSSPVQLEYTQNGELTVLQRLSSANDIAGLDIVIPLAERAEKAAKTVPCCKCPCRSFFRRH